jgi:hypothetical protein
LAALSKIVIVEFLRPVEAGANISLILHFFPGRSFFRQVVAFLGNPNSCGLVFGTIAWCFPKMIGGPLLAGLLRVTVSTFVLPTLTSPKSSVDGLTFSTGTPLGVAVAVGVGVRVDVGVAVEVWVDVAVCVGVAVLLAVAVGVAPVDVALGVAVAVLVAVAVEVGVAVCVAVAVAPVDVALGVAVAVGVAVLVDVAVTVGVPPLPARIVTAWPTRGCGRLPAVSVNVAPTGS